MKTKIASVLAATAALVALPAASASAASHADNAAQRVPMSSKVGPSDWNGQPCELHLYATSVWGWCDGTGPQRYQIWVACSNGYGYGSASTPWFGDRGGAWAYCPSGTYAEYGWWDYA